MYKDKSMYHVQPRCETRRACVHKERPVHLLPRCGEREDQFIIHERMAGSGGTFLARYICCKFGVRPSSRRIGGYASKRVEEHEPSRRAEETRFSAYARRDRS